MPLRYMRGSQEWHVVLPADYGSDLAKIRVHHGSVEPSPNPQIKRSIAVGISLRCLPARRPSAPERA